MLGAVPSPWAPGWGSPRPERRVRGCICNTVVPAPREPGIGSLRSVTSEGAVCWRGAFRHPWVLRARVSAAGQSIKQMLWLACSGQARPGRPSSL